MPKGLRDFIGKWLGDETDEEWERIIGEIRPTPTERLKDALREVSDMKTGKKDLVSAGDFLEECRTSLPEGK